MKKYLLNNAQRETAKIYFGIHLPLTFKVEPIDGDPAHLITVTKYENVADAAYHIGVCWILRGKPARVMHILN